MSEAKVELLSPPIYTSPNGLYVVNIGQLNDNTPSYLVTNSNTSVHEYITQSLPDAMTAANSLDQELRKLQGAVQESTTPWGGGEGVLAN